MSTPVRFTKQANGTWSESGAIDSRRVYIHSVREDGTLADVGASFKRTVAERVIREGIATGRTGSTVEYRLLPAANGPAMSEDTKQLLREHKREGRATPERGDE